MKIGILNADTVELPGASAFGQYPEMFSKIFWAIDPTIQFETYEVQFDHYPKKINDCERILDNSDMKYKILLQEKNKENETLKKEIISLSENLEKFRSICQRKVKGVYALQEQKGKQSVKDHKELFEYARNIGIDIFSSPFDKSAVDFLEQFNPSAYKIASFEITDYELVRYTASKKRPIIISTGIATNDEIEDVIKICKKEGNYDIILLKCTSAYPAPPQDANLLTIPDLAEKFDVISGFSDHTLGDIAPVTAVALGAKVLEKHFILDKSIGGPDSEFSLDKKDFKKMISSVRTAEKLLGEVSYEMTDKKIKSRQFARSLYVSRSIKKGEKFSKENIRSVRPGYGMHPKKLKDMIGKTANKDFEIGDRLKE